MAARGAAKKTEGKGDGHHRRGLHRQSAIGARKLRHRIF